MDMFDSEDIKECIEKKIQMDSAPKTTDKKVKWEHIWNEDKNLLVGCAKFEYWIGKKQLLIDYTVCVDSNSFYFNEQMKVNEIDQEKAFVFTEEYTSIVKLRYRNIAIAYTGFPNYIDDLLFQKGGVEKKLYDPERGMCLGFNLPGAENVVENAKSIINQCISDEKKFIEAKGLCGNIEY